MALGANLGDARRTLREARALLEQRLVDAGATSIRFSRLYRTEPVGPPQPRYFNAACAFDAPPSLTAPRLLEILQSIERAFGRTRIVRWGPRTLDLDLLVVGAVRRSDPWLTLPHPRMTQRAFVLLPLEEVSPRLHVVGAGTVRHLARLVDRDGVWPVTSEGAGWGPR